MQFMMWSGVAAFLAAFAVQIAHAQPPSVGQVVHQNPVYSGAVHSTSDCKQSTLTAADFMRNIQTIVAHGDLTDVPFIESVLKTKFVLSYYTTTADGNLNTDALLYHADHILGVPINDNLWVDKSKELQLKTGRVAVMSIDTQSLPDFNADFIRDCLHMPVSSFYSFFGGNFLGGVINGRGASTKKIYSVGNGKPTMSLNIGYSPNDFLVNHIGIAESKCFATKNYNCNARFAPHLYCFENRDIDQQHIKGCCDVSG